MKVNWTDTALQNLQSLHDYIAQNSPRYALQVVDRLTRRSGHIVLFPMSGRKVPEYDHEQIREVIEGAYRIIYHIRPDRIDILAVVHGAQPLPRD